MRRNVSRASLAVFFVAVGISISSADENGFRPLFDGATLNGWEGDTQLWSVEDGVIVGSTEAKTIRKNTFLATKETFGNFILKAKFKLRNGNSGIQFRSQQFDDFVVRGLQADIAEKRYMGILYDEGGSRGILVDVDPDEVATHVHADDWNEYVITVNGNHVRQELNGHTTVDFEDSAEGAAVEGVIALQLHVGPPMKVQFKDLLIKALP